MPVVSEVNILTVKQEHKNYNIKNLIIWTPRLPPLQHTHTLGITAEFLYHKACAVGI